MSTFVKAISDLISLFFEALRLAVTLPALVLVGLNVALIGPEIEHTQLYAWLSSADHDLQRFFIFALVVILLAYTLSVLNLPIIRFFEGYPWINLPFGRWKRTRNARRVQNLKRNIGAMIHEISTLNEQISILSDRIARAQEDSPQGALAEVCRKDQNSLAETVLQRDQKQFECNAYVNDLVLAFPHHQTWRILPTHLGNVIANAEEEPGYLFGIDSVAFWPFLAPILTRNGYAAFVEREKAVFDFLINMAVVSIVFGIELVYVDYLVGVSPWWSPPLKALVCVAVSYLFYQASVQGAAGWGSAIKTAFVLYRESLRKELRIAPPSSFFDEYNRWERAGRFFRDHDVTVVDKLFDFGPVGNTPPSDRGLP